MHFSAVVARAETFSPGKSLRETESKLFLAPSISIDADARHVYITIIKYTCPGKSMKSFLCKKLTLTLSWRDILTHNSTASKLVTKHSWSKILIVNKYAKNIQNWQIANGSELT